MTWRIPFFYILLFGFQSGYAQQILLEFKLVDEATGYPISAAHVFISNSSIGTISDSEGLCELSISSIETQTCVISHISYETLVISHDKYPLLIDGVDIKMTSNGIELGEIELTSKRSGKWKKNLKKFKRALLGTGKAASNCNIINPEVLRFEENDGNFQAKAIDLLKIDNDYLGYTINFWLEELIVESDGSKFYKGNGQFIDKLDTGDKRRQKRREQAYQNSLAHFLRSLLLSPDKETLDDHGYLVSIEQYNEGIFTNMSLPEPPELIQPDLTPGFYQLHFSDFLTIKHNTLIESSSAKTKVSISGNEQQKFGSNESKIIGSKSQMALSRLYKIKPYLIFDIRGNIVNKSAVKEYDYWASQRLATTLPVNYKTFLDTITLRPTIKPLDTLLVFKNLVDTDDKKTNEAIGTLSSHWSNSYIAPLLDILRLTSNHKHKQDIIKALLKEHAPQFEPSYYDGLQWLWKHEPSYGTYYAEFKGYLYKLIDPAFYKYFSGRDQQSTIRMDEVVWGGVLQDGIPPLRSPQMIPANQAQYLSDTDVVFAMVIGGQAVAYPKRILAWHEFFTDQINGQYIAGVYCTLCGTVIIYNTGFNGVQHDLGTSGFLYRSNKLMYDHATQSLWSTMLGQPVIGPLVGQGIELKTLPIETTTWGDWSRQYPDTKVLSLETGHDRNYDEGAAYKDYYSNDALMFPVPKEDPRLLNKTRVFIPRPKNYKASPLAISVNYLQRKGIHHDQIGDQPILILTESNGASRAYAIDDQNFKSYTNGELLDDAGKSWDVTSSALIGGAQQKLLRIPAHETFWFAWINVFPLTRLVN